MKITQWFNVQERSHMEAYIHLREKGFWPEGFIPEGMEFEPGWQILLMGMISDEYIRQLEKTWETSWMEGT